MTYQKCVLEGLEALFCKEVELVLQAVSHLLWEEKIFSVVLFLKQFTDAAIRCLLIRLLGCISRALSLWAKIKSNGEWFMQNYWVLESHDWSLKRRRDASWSRPKENTIVRHRGKQFLTDKSDPLVGKVASILRGTFFLKVNSLLPMTWKSSSEAWFIYQLFPLLGLKGAKDYPHALDHLISLPKQVLQLNIQSHFFLWKNPIKALFQSAAESKLYGNS